MSATTLNLHAFLPRSRANGPGWRSVIWFQGCTLDCPGCFNPDTHTSEPRQLIAPKELVSRCQAAEGTEGITVSGGEPFQQTPALLAFLQRLRAETGLSVLLFSGYSRAEIDALPSGREILACADVLIAGRFDRTQPCADGLRTSKNQGTHFLTNRYTPADLSPRMIEVILQPGGRTVVTGFPATVQQTPTHRPPSELR